MIEKDSFVGCLIGQCLGDALGSQVADCDPKVCLRSIAHEFSNWKTGTPTVARLQFGESSQLARELLLSYAEQGSYDSSHYAARIRDLVVLKQIFRRKLETHLASKQLLVGRPWSQAGTPSIGNGGAARVAPLGLLFPTQTEARANAAREQCSITHQSELSASGAVVVASAVALACRKETNVSTTFLDLLVAECPDLEPQFLELLRKLQTWLSLEKPEASERILQTGSVARNAYPCTGLCPHVVPTVLWALYCFLTAKQDYWSTVCNTLTIGGDVPAAAAISGALSGASNGLRGIPLQAAERLSDRGICGFDDLVGVAERAFQVANANSSTQR